MNELPVDVMHDLLTLYLAGEASENTRRMVEDYAASHPRYAAALRNAGTLTLPAPPAQAAEAPPDTDLATLRRIREHVLLRTIFMAAAIATTLIPFAFRFHGRRVEFLFWNGLEGIAYASLSIAAASWVGCYVMHRALRRSGV